MSCATTACPSSRSTPIAPPTEFDLLAFNLSAELVYTNVLDCVDLAGVPVRNEDRRAEHPLIAAGGHATFNPEPLADYVDFFVIGEGEEVVAEITEVVREWKASGRTEGSRHQVLRRLAAVEGVYVPVDVRGDLRRTPPGGRDPATTRTSRRRSSSAPWPIWPTGPTRSGSWSR